MSTNEVWDIRHTTPPEVSQVRVQRLRELSAALGNPATVDALDGDTIDDALIELAINELNAAKELRIEQIARLRAEKESVSMALGDASVQINELKKKLTEANLKYISDFGQLQAQEPIGTFEQGPHSCIGFIRNAIGPQRIFNGDKLYAAAGAAPGFDLIKHLQRQIAFSQRTFGPGERTAGVIDHIRKELIEIEGAPSDLTEWVDLILLAFDGAWRAGHTAEAICTGIDAKQTKNEGRTWPDWRTAPPGKAIEHVRSAPPSLEEQRLAEDVVVGGNTFRKGVSLSTFILAAQNWHREAYPEGYALTDEQKRSNLAALQACATVPGLAMESGEFVPASEIAYHPV